MPETKRVRLSAQPAPTPAVTRVVNKRTDSFDIYIGRGSEWGNPFTVQEYGRDLCIDKYERQLRERLNKEPELVKSLLLLKGKTLGCFCKPHRCHGDVLAEIIKEYETRTQEAPAPTEYSIIYADPPWSYDDKAKNRGGAERHYVTTSDAELAKIQIPAARDAVMFMWATFPKIQDAINLMQAWGFEYRTVAFVWVKANKKQTDSPFWGMGQWTRANAEVCLIGVRGKPQRQGKGVHQLIVEPEIITDPVMQHSRKPACVRDKIVELMGDVPRLEMFAREATPGWQVFGDEAPGGIDLPVKRVRRSQQ